MNHPFLDGNKRIGALAMLTMLDLNNVTLEASNKELTETILQIAAGTLDEAGLLSWVIDHIA